MKKLLVALLALLLLAGCASCPECETCEVCGTPAKTVADLPAARDTSKKSGENACTVDNYSLDCSSINSSNLKDYLNIEGVVYIDARDYKDFATKHLRNFECIPYFGLIMSSDGSAGVQLFSGETTAPVATYAESVEILTDLIPTDKVVFLMCQSGGRIKKLMEVMASTGKYDMSKVYNIGGMAQYGDYEGITVAEDIVVTATYDFNGLTKN